MIEEHITNQPIPNPDKKRPIRSLKRQSSIAPNLEVGILRINRDLIEKAEKEYILNQNLENLSMTPIYIKEPTNILFSKDFDEKSWKHFIDFYQYNNDESNENLNKIKDKFKDFYETAIKWLTISGSKIRMNNISLKIKLHLTGKSCLTSNYSFYTPQSLSKTESAIEIFANSKCHFKNCHFYNAERAAVIVKSFSSAIFENCVFCDNTISCYILDDSYASFKNCKFINNSNISVFLSKRANADIINCEFLDLKGKAIFLNEYSKAYVTNCSFINCAKGAATAAKRSSLYLENNIKIKNTSNTALRACFGSFIQAYDVTMEKIDGNAINIDYSTGYFYKCEMKEVVHPTIAVLGRKSNPVFHDCQLLDNGNTLCVVSKSGSRPSFYNCTFSDCDNNCFSVCDFSAPFVENCKFYNIKGNIFNVYSGGSIIYDNAKYNNSDMIKMRIAENSSCIKLIDDFPQSLSNCEHCVDCCNHHEHENCNNEDEFKDEHRDENEIDYIEMIDFDSDDKNDDDDETKTASYKYPNYDPIPTIFDDFILNKVLPIKTKKQKIFTLEKITSNIKEDTNFICSNCSRKIAQNPFILSSCGHIVCEDCIEISACPICNNKSKGKKLFIEQNCSICMENRANTISLPCGHLCMCYECASKVFEKGFNCPMCNEHLTNFKIAYNDVSTTIEKHVNKSVIPGLENERLELHT